MSTILQRIFIDKLGANARMKEHFTRDVVSIEWFAKLAPSTLNIVDGLDVHEIAVFVVPLKTKECPDDIFVFIEKMMPRHLLETPREFDPRGQSDDGPCGQISLALCGKIELAPENDCFSGAFL